MERDRVLPTVQVLRGVAASLVVFHHFARLYSHGTLRRSWILDSGIGDLCMCGVDIFFVISGFIMVYTTKGKLGVGDSLVFMKRRVLRIFPLYWIWTTVLLLLLLSGLALRNEHYPTSNLVLSYFLIPSWDGTYFHPLLGQGWTLSFEMLFYLIFALGISFGLRAWKVAFAGATFGVLALIGQIFSSDSAVRYLFSNSIVIEFLFGMIVAETVLRIGPVRSSRFEILSLALMVLGGAALLLTVRISNPDQHRFFFYGIPSLLMVFGAVVRGSAPAPRLLTYLGDASYSIYLVHDFIALAFATALTHRLTVQRFPPDLAIVVCGIITIALSSLPFPLIERPMNRAFSLKTSGGSVANPHLNPRTP